MGYFQDLVCLPELRLFLLVWWRLCGAGSKIKSILPPSHSIISNLPKGFSVVWCCVETKGLQAWSLGGRPGSWKKNWGIGWLGCQWWCWRIITITIIITSAILVGWVYGWDWESQQIHKFYMVVLRVVVLTNKLITGMGWIVLCGLSHISSISFLSKRSSRPIVGQTCKKN